MKNKQVECAFAMGNFDGVHCGHRKLLSQLVSFARERSLRAVVLTFDPHPRQILNPAWQLRRLTPPIIQEPILHSMGVKTVIYQNFTQEFSHLNPREFVEAIVFERLRPRSWFIGQDFLFGKNQSGNQQTLDRLGKQLGFEVHVIKDFLDQEGGKISSRKIRKDLEDGQLAKVNAQLGYPFFFQGRVVHGDARGRKLGFRTANLEVDNELFPPNGVYAGAIKLNAVWLPVAVNIGTRPTFSVNEQSIKIECHIVNYQGNLYGSQIRVCLLERLRPEVCFPNKYALGMQIKKDIAGCQSIFDQGRGEKGFPIP